jgi:putative transposase
MMPQQKYRKRIRLPISAYEVPGSVWHVTNCCVDREPVFSDSALAKMVCEQIVWYSERYNITAHAWCVMPDHMHLVAQVNDQSLIKMLGAFKSFTTRLAWKLGHTGPLWQESFHDHGIRQIEDFEAAVGYLLENPQRAGLVEEAADYPWRGGVVLEEM